MAIVLDGTANTVSPLNGALGATTPSTVAATTVVASSTIKGATTIAVGNATPSASGAGITFPATQSASTDANTLDDYEEGTFTALFNCGSGSITLGGGYGNTLSYVKIGNTVTISGRVSTTAVSSPSGVLNIPLPFPCYYGLGTINVEFAVLNSNDYILWMGGGSNMQIYKVITTSYGNAAADFSGNEYVYLSATYIIL